MKLHQLEYLVAVAEEGSMSRAARRMGVAQPALSQQIRILEEELGCSLFTRTTRGACVTSSGRILLEHARSVVERIDMARHDVLMNGRDVSGEVIIVFAHAIAQFIMPALLARLHRSFPKVRLRVQAATSPEVQLMLENSRVDLGVLPDRDDITKINANPLLTQGLYFVCAPGYLDPTDEGAETITLEKALRHPLAIVERGRAFRRTLETVVQDHGLAMNIRYESDLLVLLLGYVAAGVAGSILPWSAVRDKVALGEVAARRIVEPVIDQHYIVAWPKSRPLNRPSVAVRDRLLEVAREVPRQIS